MNKILTLIKTLIISIGLIGFVSSSSAFFYSGDYYGSTSGNSYSFNGNIFKVGSENIVIDSYGVSNGSYSVNPSYNSTTGNVTGTITGIKGKTLAWINFRNTVNGEKKTYYVNAISTFNSFGVSTVNYTLTNGIANFNIIDPENVYLTASGALQNRNYKFISNNNTDIVSDSNGENIFSLEKRGAIYYFDKKSKTGETLNTYEIVFRNLANAIIANATINSALISYMYVAGGMIHLSYNNELYKTVGVGSSISIVDGVITIKGTGTTGNFKNINNVMSTVDTNIVSPKKTIQKGNILYTLTNGSFQIDYVKGSSYDLKESISVTDIYAISIDDFYIVDNNIILYSGDNGYYYLNGDYILYSYYDASNSVMLDKTINNIFDYSVRELYTKSNITKSGDIGSILNVPLTTGGVSGTEKYIKDPVLKLLLDPSKVTQASFSKSINVIKYTSLSFGVPSNIDIVNVTGNIPLIGYGILIENSNSCTRTDKVVLNTPVTTTSKIFDVQDGNYCIYISPYDEGYNTLLNVENVKLGGSDILLKNNKIVFGDPEIQRNTIGDTVKDIDFYIYSSKELKTMSVNFLNRDLDLVNKTLTGTGADKIQFISSTNNSYKYVFHTNIIDLNQTTTFNISGSDYYNNNGNLIYQYDVFKGYYQVIGLTQTNAGVSGNLNKEQMKKGFMYGLSSSNSENKDNVKTMFFFDKPNKIETLLPTKLVGSETKVDLDLLKFNIKDFRGKSMKEFVYDPNKKDYVFENGYYYYYDGDLTLSGGLNYYGNGMLVVSGKINIKGNITKNILSETKKYYNNLKIYSTNDIVIYNSVSKIDGDVFTNKIISTYSNTSSNSVNSGLGTFIDTNGLFIIGISNYGDQL